VVGSADVRVKIYTLPNGVEPSSCQLSLARENYQARTAATKHPSAGRRSHTRTRVCFTPGTNSAIATKPPTALELLLPQRREPRKCSCSTQKRRAFPGLLELVLALDCREIWLLNKRYIFGLSVSQPFSRRVRVRLVPYAGRLPLGYQGLSFLSETASPKRRCSKRDLEILASRWSAARQ
jgi:hypothetical protein